MDTLKTLIAELHDVCSLCVCVCFPIVMKKKKKILENHADIKMKCCLKIHTDTDSGIMLMKPVAVF